MNFAAWYWDRTRPDVASYWDGGQWLQTLPLTQLVGVRVIDRATGQPIPPRQPPAGTPAQEPSRQVPMSEVTWFVPKSPRRKRVDAPMKVLIGILVALGVAAGWVWVIASNPSPSSTSPVAEKTKANGLKTCKDLISQQPHGGGNETIQSDVLVGDLYKTNIVYEGLSEVHRWTCRLEWVGSRWRVDILESKRLQ
ncbi:hypothetical protein [Paenarthrobacter sp. YJN-5]|uniref:hypothetical protein n=1 Tax=Paenarthrobacter sp. YJN-5 TaxID=2735316 RepID=UPI001877DC6A|nr:hypothetical protein [Paenarthrobacter sp. YJN-5]QOT19424.1 hypothetical protein HMI59_22500 [Paenarthrobacter sp. YJN-5]